jgi:hypothetical protein
MPLGQCRPWRLPYSRAYSLIYDGTNSEVRITLLNAATPFTWKSMKARKRGVSDVYITGWHRAVLHPSEPFSAAGRLPRYEEMPSLLPLQPPLIPSHTACFALIAYIAMYKTNFIPKCITVGQFKMCRPAEFRGTPPGRLLIEAGPQTRSSCVLLPTVSQGQQLAAV